MHASCNVCSNVDTVMVLIIESNAETYSSMIGGNVLAEIFLCVKYSLT